MNARKLISTSLISLCVLAAGLVFTSMPAFAEATHVFSKTIGGPCTGAGGACEPGQLKEPQGVAVNESTGDVYVVDKGTNSVKYFSSAGKYEGEFNGSVPNALGEKPPAPLEGPESIAVDNDLGSPSEGDVYVADLANGVGVVDKFTATGEYVNQVTETGAWNHPPFSGPSAPLGGPKPFEVEGESKIASIEGLSVAVGSNGEFWVYQNRNGPPGFVDNFSNSRTNMFLSTRRDGSSEGAFAVDASEDFYLYVGSGEGVAKFDSTSENPLLDGFDTEPTTGLAVELSTSSVYVDNVGTVAKFSSEGASIERFGSGRLTSGTGIAVDSLSGTVDVAEDTTDVVVVFADQATAPSVETEEFSKVSGLSATLSAKVNTHGPPTTYTIEYGTSKAYGSTAKTGTIGGSFAGPAAVSATLEGLLQPETTYHFRIVAENADGKQQGGDVAFTTLGDLPGLPDGRGYELVSPVANANGNVYFPAEQETRGRDETSLLPMRASGDGGAVEYEADPLATGGNGNIGVAIGGNRFVATRGPEGGWSATDLETPELDQAPFDALFSSELANSGTSTVPAGSDRLSAGGESQEVQDGKESLGIFQDGHTNVYFAGAGAEGLFDSAGGRSVEVSVLPAGASGERGVAVADASFGGPAAPGFGEGNVARSVEGPGPDLSHVISADGSRIYWTDLEAGPDENHIYVRINASRTLPVSVGAAKFWTASPDGRVAFYTEGERLWRFDVEGETREDLTPEGVAHESAAVRSVIGINETGGNGSYVYFVAGGVLAENENTHGEKASFQTCIQAVSGISGSTPCNLYVLHGDITKFIATLAPGDNELEALWSGDLGDSFSYLGARTAEVTPNGQHLVFRSRASLTGYDNKTILTNPYIGQSEAVDVSEVFVYDADTARTLCVSCNPSGVPPLGGSETSLPAVSLPRSYSGVFLHHWVSEDGSRVFFDSTERLVAQDTNGMQDVYEWEREGDGSCAQVVPARTSGGCIYLLSGGSSTDNSYLLDASANGNDVFIITRAQLTPQDQGDTYELYDARVGASEPLAEQTCTGTGCQGLPAAPPPFATPSSITFNGIGNFPPSAPAVVKKVTKKTVKCKKGDTKNKKGKCVPKKKKKAKAKKSAHTNRRAS